MRRYRARRRAAGLRPVRGWAPREATWSDYRIAEARSLVEGRIGRDFARRRR